MAMPHAVTGGLRMAVTVKGIVLWRKEAENESEFLRVAWSHLPKEVRTSRS